VVVIMALASTRPIVTLAETALRWIATLWRDRLKYATLGLLFVNVSIGGTLTHFAAPPVLMVERPWGWDTPFMLAHFGWRAALAIGSVQSLAGARSARVGRALHKCHCPRSRAPHSSEVPRAAPTDRFCLHTNALGRFLLFCATSRRIFRRLDVARARTRDVEQP